MTEWVANDHYTLVYNDKYWGEEPSVKKVIVRTIPDATTQDLMFQSGELDLIDLGSLDSAIVASVYKTVYADRIVSTPKVGMTYLIMNENNEYLKDVRVPLYRDEQQLLRKIHGYAEAVRTMRQSPMIRD